jgi:hypothetical protein
MKDERAIGVCGKMGYRKSFLKRLGMMTETEYICMVTEPFFLEEGVIGAYRSRNGIALIEDESVFNVYMAKQRMAVDWGFGEMMQRWWVARRWCGVWLDTCSEGQPTF